MKFIKSKKLILDLMVSPLTIYLSVGLLLFVLESDARVGGGHSYGGGGSRSSGSRSSGHSYSGGGYSGGGDGGFIADLIIWIIRICIRYPAFGIPFTLIVLFIIYHYYKKTKEFDGYYSDYEARAPAIPVNRTRDFVQEIQKYDSNFSYPLFKDFIFSLYSQFQELRGEKKLDLLSQYFSEALINKYNRNEILTNVDGVVMGNCQLQSLKVNTECIELSVFFSANYSETYKDGKIQKFILKETWKLKRSVKALSRPPEEIVVLSCPNCGAANTDTTQGKCFSCGETNKNGKFGWYVFEINTIKDFFIESRNTHAILAPSIVEEGTRLPTVRDPMIDQALSLNFKDKTELEYARKRFVDIFMNLQKAWAQQKWELARPFESDALFQSHRYWIEDYKKKKEINVIDKIEIEKVVPVALFRDEFYQAFTVRIFAKMIDYTQNQSGKVILGSKSKKIEFSEYWTFIKGIGPNHKNAKIKNTANCPSCGAELKIAMSGNCEFCGSKITLGQFDWVLSQIEQDEEFNL